MALKLSNFEAGAIEQGIGFGLGALVGSALEPIAQDQKNRIFARITSGRIDPSNSAIAVLEDLWTADRGAEEAAQSGLDRERFDVLRKIIDIAPDFGVAFDLWRRGKIGDDDMHGLFKKLHLEAKWFAPLLELKRVLLSPSDFAMARQQGFLDESEARSRSNEQGVIDADADLLFEMSGLPPGIGEAMTMLRRGLIDEAKFAEMVREGHTKTKYTNLLLQLRDNVPSVTAAVEGLVRERIGRPEAERIAALNGFSTKDFELLYEIAGRPISITQALTLYNRKQYTVKDVEAVVARSNVRPEFTPEILKLAVRYPPLFQISRLVANGSIDDAYALELIEHQGFPTKLAEGIVHAAHAAKTGHSKDLSLSVIETLYDAGLETSEHAQKLLEGLGYDQAEAKSLLNVHDARRYAAEMARAATIIRTKYINHLIDRGTALAELGSLSGTAEARDRTLKLWDLERDANVRALTPSEVGQAVKYSIITDEEAVQRWVNLGYAQADAQIKLQIVHKGPAHPAVGTTP